MLFNEHFGRRARERKLMDELKEVADAAEWDMMSRLAIEQNAPVVGSMAQLGGFSLMFVARAGALPRSILSWSLAEALGCTEPRARTIVEKLVEEGLLASHAETGGSEWLTVSRAAYEQLGGFGLCYSEREGDELV